MYSPRRSPRDQGSDREDPPSPRSPRPPCHSNVSQIHKKIKSFADVKIKPNCARIDLSRNLIEDFRGLPSLPVLSQLNLDNNPVRSFEGCVNLPKLRWLSMKNTPLTRNIHFKTMCLVAFGGQLATINNEQIPDAFRKQADTLRDSLFPQLQKGMIISSLKPLRLIDMNKSQCVVPEEDLIQASQKVGWTSPVIKAKNRRMRFRYVSMKPSVAALCDELLEQEDIDFMPREVIIKMTKRLQELRSEHNAEIEQAASQEDNTETEITPRSDDEKESSSSSSEEKKEEPAAEE